MHAFYGGHARDWFHVPAWQLNVFVAALPQLRAERQLMAIEAGLVVAAVAIKPEEAKRIMGRHQRALTPPEEKKPQPPALALLDGFRAHGLAVVEQTVAKPSV